MSEGRATQTFSSAVLHRASAESWQVLILLYTKDTVRGSQPMLSRQQRMLKFHCSRQVQLM